jgi:hypothetical protein
MNPAACSSSAAAGEGACACAIEKDGPVAARFSDVANALIDEDTLAPAQRIRE